MMKLARSELLFVLKPMIATYQPGPESLGKVAWRRLIVSLGLDLLQPGHEIHLHRTKWAAPVIDDRTNIQGREKH